MRNPLLSTAACTADLQAMSQDAFDLGELNAMSRLLAETRWEWSEQHFIVAADITLMFLRTEDEEVRSFLRESFTLIDRVLALLVDFNRERSIAMLEYLLSGQTFMSAIVRLTPIRNTDPAPITAVV